MPKVEFVGDVPEFQRFALNRISFEVDIVLIQHMPPARNEPTSPLWERKAYVTIHYSVRSAFTGEPLPIVTRKVVTYSIVDELAAHVRRMIAEFAAHEASHAICRDGVPVFDPHPEETAAARATADQPMQKDER